MANLSTVKELLGWISQSSNPRISNFLSESSPRFIARAPGRLDLMGGIADYSGSLVLQWPIREATWAIVQPTNDTILHIASADLHAPGTVRDAVHNLASFTNANQPISYPQAREYFASDPETKWSAYVAGVFLVLMHERNIHFQNGARILLLSDVPEGKGVSSSAALEVSTMTALAKAFDIELTGSEIGALCQKVENEVVGAPCGIMDQMASSCAESGSLMALRCRPAELLGNVKLPDGMQIWGIDSGVRHSVSGADYGTVRTAAFMGLAIIEEVSGKSLDGYLTKLSPSEVAPYVSHLPESITGADFIAQFGSINDPQSKIIPDRHYPVRAAALHPINEHFRVNTFRKLLALPTTPKHLHLLGELMYQAHLGYTACGLGTPQTDRLVELVRESGTDSGLYGAKITGGGSGGTVAILGETGSDQAVQSIADKYRSETNLEPYIFTGTSPGASAYGVAVH